MLALAPALPAFHTVAVVAGFICVIAVCYWFIHANKIPPPWIYLVYLVICLLAIYAVYWIVGQTR